MPAKPKPIKATNTKLQLTLFFRKAKDAAIYLGCDASVIAKVCNGKMESSWGWSFEFSNESESAFMTDEQLKTPLIYEKEKLAWNAGKTGVYSEETLKLMSDNRKGISIPEESKKKLSESLLKYYSENDHHAKGVKLSEVHKQNIANGVNNLPTEKKQEISKKIKLAGRSYRASLTSAQKEEINLKRSISATKTTYGQVRLALEKADMTAMFELKADENIILDIPIHQDVKCFCGRVWNVYLNEIARGKIRSCGCQKSAPEMEIYNFIVQDLKMPAELVFKNKRPDFMVGLELDIFIPSKNFAIEFHGLAFHSERFHDDKLGNRHPRSYHLHKFELCDAKGIQLFQIFEDEWLNNSNIIKSMIKSRLKNSTNKIAARKTEVRRLTVKRQERAFFDQNHIAGYTFVPIVYGLFFNNELVASASFRKPFNKKYEQTIEIARFASKLDFQIVGGFSKLMCTAMKELKSMGYSKILTYADLRFGKGKVYELFGFTKIGRTQPNYFYEKDGSREGRLDHRKINEQAYIQQFGNTEKEQNAAQGWYRIYDAGSEIYSMDL